MSRRRLALVGYGTWGRNLARVLHRMGCLVRICDASAAARAQAQSVYPAVALAEHYGPGCGDIDAVVVATPATTHVTIAAQALADGKDVFVEKPITLNSAAAQALVQQAASKNCILMVGHLLVYHPALAVIRSYLATDLLGPLRHIDCQRHNYGTIRHEENALWSLGPHDIAVVLDLTQAIPTHIQAVGHSFLQPGICDTCTLYMAFASGVQATLSLSWLHPCKEQRVIVRGSRGAIIFDDVHKALHLQPLPLKTTADGRLLAARQPLQELSFPQQEPLQAECAAFLAAIDSRRAPRTHGTSGVNVVRILQRAQESLSYKGRRLAVIF